MCKKIISAVNFNKREKILTRYSCVMSRKVINHHYVINEKDNASNLKLYFDRATKLG